jgi:hypothetical protein
MPQVGFELTTPLLERTIIVHALDRVATIIISIFSYRKWSGNSLLGQKYWKFKAKFALSYWPQYYVLSRGGLNDGLQRNFYAISILFYVGAMICMDQEDHGRATWRFFQHLIIIVYTLPLRSRPMRRTLTSHNHQVVTLINNSCLNTVLKYAHVNLTLLAVNTNWFFLSFQ